MTYCDYEPAEADERGELYSGNNQLFGYFLHLLKSAKGGVS